MKLARLFTSVAVALVLIGCQPAETRTPESRAATAEPIATAESIDTVEPLATVESSAGDWQTFYSQEGGFSLLLPGEPQEQRQPISTAAGSVDAIMYIAEVGSSAYGVGYSDFPGDPSQVNVQAVLAGARDGAARNVNGTVVSEKPIELAGHPGLEIAVELPASSSTPGGAWYRARLYLVGHRLYQVIYVALKGDDNPTAYQKLFDSFRLDNVPAPASLSPPSSTLNGWVDYRSEEGGFTVLLPAKPKVQTQLAETSAGTAQLTVALAEMNDHAAGVSFNDIPPAAAAADSAMLLEGGREGAAKNLI